ncbi:MAG: magnesium transporter [Candidatus Binatota bacterium]|jgi:magnesium transporter|nr:magnesium transporter [Candidatus Binatota bacterium]
MTKFVKQWSRKAGLPPGTLVPVGTPSGEAVTIDVIRYSEHDVTESRVNSVEEAARLRQAGAVTWIDVSGVEDVEVLEAFGRVFGLHALVLEDVMNTDQRPKLEEHDAYLFVAVKMLGWNEARGDIDGEHMSVILGEDFVISFGEKAGDVFDPVRERIRKAKVRIRKMGADYLAYALLDMIVDNYFGVLERLGSDVDELEQQLLDDRAEDPLSRLHQIKREIVYLRKSVWPLRDVVSGLLRSDCTFVREEIKPFLHDLYDHTIQVMDTIETFRDISGGLMDLHLSVASNRMNSVMKVLTVIATIFMPPTLLVGVYGMNFEFMPELHSRWGYPMVWVGIVLVVTGMLAYFRKMRWI